MKLWLVRHAPAQVAPGLCYGRSDVPAEPDATAQAAARLAAALPTDVAVWTSPATRCRQLANALQASRPDLRAAIDERLQEMDFGEWELRAWDAIGPAALTAWTDDFADHRPGGGESVRSMLDRVSAALADARRTPTPVLWITHAGVIRAVRWYLQDGKGLPTAAQWPREPVAFGQAEAHELGDD